MDTFEDPFSLSALLDDAGDDQHPVAADFEIPEEFGRTAGAQDDSPISSSSLFRVSDVCANTQLSSGGQTSMGGASANSNIGAPLSSHSGSLFPVNNSLLTSICDSNGISEKNLMPVLAPAIYQQSSCSPSECLDASKKSHNFSSSQLNSHDLPVANDQLLVGESQSDGSIFSTLNCADSSTKRTAGRISAEYHGNNFIPASPNPNLGVMLHQPAINGANNHLYNNFQSNAPFEHTPATFCNDVSGDRASRSSSTCSSSQPVHGKSNLERTTSPLDGPTMSPLTNGNYSASDHSTYNSRNVSRNPSPVGDKCANCVLLKKKLNNSKQWNKFLKEKLIITDKLFQRADDLERDHQRYLELQLAYDQRTREWRYQQEQLVQLLQEVQPLKEKLAEVEKELAATKRMRTESDMSKHALQVSCEQYKARIDALSAKVNPLNQEIMEKKLQRRMAEIRRLRTEIEVKNTDIHDMKAYIRDHKLFYERQNKKSLWALGLAKKLSSDASEATLDEDTRSRLQCTYLDTQNNLVSQYEAFRRTSERQLEGDFLGLSLLPSFEQWLDDFDREGHSQWDFNPEHELKSGYKYEKSKKKRLDSGSSTGVNESIKSTGEDAQKNKTETPQGTELQKVKKKRGPYKKKTPEEKKAIKMAGAKIEQLLMGVTEANNTNNSSTEGRNESVAETSLEKSISNKEAAKQPKSNITKNSNARSIKVHENPKAASDSDEYLDCPSPSDSRFFPSPPKLSVPSDSGSVGTFSRSSSTNSALPKQSNSLDARREQPFEVSEKSLFGDDSSDDGSDTENAPKNKPDGFPRDDRPRNLPSVSPTVTASDKKVDGKEQRLHSKPLAAKEGLLPIGRSIHGVAKVGRVFDRQVVSSCVKRGHQQRPLQDEPIKLGASKKPLAPSYNVKEIGNLMRERMKEKQTVLTGGGKPIRAPPVPSAAPTDAAPTVCKRRSHSVLAPVKSKSLLDSNSLSAASKGILSMEEKSLTKYKSQNQDPSMFSSSDSSDNECPSHSPFSRSRVRSPIKLSKNYDKSSSEINESSLATVRSPPKPRVSQPIETSKSVSSVSISPAENPSKLNHNQIEHRPVVSKANISLNGSKEDVQMPNANPEDRGAKARPTECNQSNREKEKTSPRKLSENAQTQLHETNSDDEAPAENGLEHGTVVRTSFLQNENQVTEIDTHFASEHSDEQRAILSDDLAMSSDSEDNDEEDYVKTTTAAQSPVRRAAHAVYAEDFNLSDASPERPSRPPSIPLRHESPSKEQVSSSTAQSTLEATTKDQFDIPSKDLESSRTSTPIKKPAHKTPPLDISDVVRSLSLDDSQATEARNEMKQNGSARAEVRSGSVSGQINTDNVRVASIFDDEDSCFTPTLNEPSPSQVSDGLATSEKMKIPTAYAGLNLSLTDDETDDSDGEGENIRTSIYPSELAAEPISPCDNSNKVEKCTSSAQLSAMAKSKDEETLEDSVFIGNDEESSTSVVNSHVRERSFNSEVVSGRIENNNVASLVNVDTKDSTGRNSSSVASPGSGAFDNDEPHNETLTRTDRGESKSPPKDTHEIGSLSNLRSDSERSIDNEGNVANSHEMSETPLRNAGDSSDAEKCSSTDSHPPVVVDTCAQSGAASSLSKSSSPVRRITRVRSQSSSSTSRRNCSSADSKADFGSPHSYRLRKRVSSHDSENESTPSKAISSKRLRTESGRKSGVRCRDNSFSLKSPTKTPDQTLEAESFSAEPCARGRVTRRNSTRNTDNQKEDIRSIFDVLKSPKFSSETQNFNLPSEITVHPTEDVSVSFNDGESSKMPHCSGSTRASPNTVRCQPSPASSECSSAADLVSSSVPSKENEGANNRAGFLPPVVVQTRRSSRQRRGYSSSTVSRPIAQEKLNSNTLVKITDSAEVKSIPAETQCSKGPDNKQDPSRNTTDLLHVISSDVSSSKSCVLQLTPEPPSKLNLSLTSEDDSEIMSSCDQKSDGLAPDSVVEKCSLEPEQKKMNSSTCGTVVADSTLSQKTVSSEKEGEQVPSEVQKPLQTLNEDSQHKKLKPNEKTKKNTAYGASLRANSCVSNSKASIPAKPPCEVDPTSRVSRRRKAMVFKSTKRVIVGTPPRRNLQQNKKPSLGSSEDISSLGCVGDPPSKSVSGKEKSKNGILSPPKSKDSDEGSRKIECLLPEEYASHRAHKPHVKNDAPEGSKSSENSTKISETNKFQNSVDDSESSKSFDNRRDPQSSATKSISSKLREPVELDPHSSPSDTSLEIDTCAPCINEVEVDSESEGEMCINIEEIEIEAALSTVKPSPPLEVPSLVPREETNKNQALFDEDEFTCSDEDQEERKRQSSLVQGKRKRLCSETEVRLEPNFKTSKSKQDLPQISESQSKKHKPSSIEKLPSKSFETKPVMTNSAPRPAIGKKGSFSVSQLQELERRKQTASKAANSVAPMSSAKVGLTSARVNEQGCGSRSSSKNTNDSAKTQSGDGTSDVHSVRSRAENGKERKKLMVKDRKPLARRTARLSKSAAAAATAAARRTMTGQRPKASHVNTVKRSVPSSSDDSSSDEMNVKRTPGKNSMLIESDSEPETTPLRNEKSSKVPKTCEERVSVNGNKCLDLNSVVQNMSQKFGITKKRAILLEGKTTAKPSRPTPVFDKPCVNYSVKETEVNGRRHSKNPKTNPPIASSSSSRSTESCRDGPISEHRFESPTTSYTPGGEHSDDEFTLTVDLGACNSSVNCYDAAETHSTKFSAVKHDPVELGTTKTSAHIRSAEVTTNDVNTSRVNFNSVTVPTGASKVAPASDLKIKAEYLAAHDTGERRSNQVSAENFNSTLVPAPLKPISFFGKDLLTSANSDDDGLSESSEMSPDSPSSAQELTSNPPTSKDTSEYCPIMRVPSVPVNLTSSLETAQLEYSSVLRELVNVRIGSAEWKTSVITIVQDVQQRLNEDSSIPTCTHLQLLARAFIESIICVDPTEDLSAGVKVLCPELYKLFMLAKVIESNLNVTPAHSLEDLITSMCENLVRSSGFTGSPRKKEVTTLTAGAIASLCSWHTASCCVAKKEDRKPQWRRARAFIVSLLCHYPGLAHGALLSSLFLGRFVLLRLVKYRSTTGLERVIMWLVHHGTWSGKSSVRTLLIDNMNARYACENSPAEPMVLVRSILDGVLDKVDKHTKARLDTFQNLRKTILGLMVLSCWKGKAWLLNELLPYVLRLLASKKHISAPHLSKCIVSITCTLLPRVGVQKAEIVDLLQNAEEEDGVALFAAAKYKDQKLKPDKALLSKLLGALADALRMLLHDDTS